MSKDESIKDKEQMARIIAFELCPQKFHKEWYGEYARCYADNNYADCTKIKKVVDTLYNAKYRKIADDEIVLKQSEVDEFRKDQAEAKFLKDKIKKETAREILRLIYNRIKYKESANPPEIRIVKYAAKKYGIELGE